MAWQRRLAVGFCFAKMEDQREANDEDGAALHAYWNESKLPLFIQFRYFWVSSGYFPLVHSFYLTKYVPRCNLTNSKRGIAIVIASILLGASLWHSVAKNMATNLATVEAREVLRCEHCSLVQFRTANSLCRRCHKPLEIEEAEPVQPQLVVASPESEPEGIDVARAVREIRASRNLSQRQLAGRMNVPRTYISKIENGKAVPTLGSLERLASALEVDVCALLRDARSRRHSEVYAIMSDPFLAEIASVVANLDGFQRAMFLNQVREMASGRVRRSA